MVKHIEMMAVTIIMMAMLMILKVLQIGCLRDSVHDGFTLTGGAQEGKA